MKIIVLLASLVIFIEFVSGTPSGDEVDENKTTTPWGDDYESSTPSGNGFDDEHVVYGGFGCYRCEQCKFQASGSSNAVKKIKCRNHDDLCVISLPTEDYKKGPKREGIGRRSCVKASKGRAGKCKVTPYIPADNFYDRADSNDSDSYTTCYCNDSKYCNGSEGFLTSSLWSLGLTIITAFALPAVIDV